MTVQNPDVVHADQAEHPAAAVAQGTDARADQIVDVAVHHPADDVTVVAVAGEIDMLSAPELRAAMAAHLADNTTFVLDMTGVSFLGSAGLAALVEGLQQSRRRGIAFRIVAVERAVTRPLVATGLGDVFAVFGTVEEALAAD